MKKATIRNLTLLLLPVALLVTSCNPPGQNNDAADDLLNAFEAGCTLQGSYLATALAETQSFSDTLKDLEQKNSCAGVSGALDNLGLVQGQIQEINNNAFASQVSQLSVQQKMLMLQMSQTSDPVLLSTLSNAYATNLVDMASAQSSMVTANGGVSTPLQLTSQNLSSYLGQLSGDQSNMFNCGQNNPAMAAQMGSGLLAVAGSFTGPVTGVALSLAGQVLSDAISFIHNAAYETVIDQLDQTKMATALPCGLEQMMDVYCQAEDLKQITNFEACNYNPKLPQCAQPTPKPGQAKPADTTKFWQGLDVLTRELPAMQIWINDLVTGVLPSDPQAAQRVTQAADAVHTMDDVLDNAAGVMNDETNKISLAGTPSEQIIELRHALGLLTAVLATDTPNVSCLGVNFGGGCPTTPIVTDIEGSATKILYDLVNADLGGCNPSDALGGNCADYTSIDLSKVTGSTVTATWQAIEANSGGVPGLGAGKNLIGLTQQHELDILNQLLNPDASDVLLKSTLAAGTGLNSPIRALNLTAAWAQASHDYIADPTQVPDSYLGDAAPQRARIVGLLQQTHDILIGVQTALDTSDGSPDSDTKTLSNIVSILQLSKGRDWLATRLQDQIGFDAAVRIKAGQIPSNIYDILSQTQVDPTVGLTQIPATQMDQTLASLDQSQVTSQLNLDGMVSFFGKSLQGIITLMKQQADKNGEPMHADPISAPNRMNQARACLLVVSSQDTWPSDIDLSLCQGLSFSSAVTGEVISFNGLYEQMTKGINKVPQRMCTFYRFYRTSENYTHNPQSARLTDVKRFSALYLR